MRFSFPHVPGSRRREGGWAIQVGGWVVPWACAPAHLVAAVAAPKLLDRLVRRPGQLQREVHPLPPVPPVLVRVQRDAGRGGVADDGDQLLALRSPGRVGGSQRVKGCHAWVYSRRAPSVAVHASLPPALTRSCVPDERCSVVRGLVLGDYGNVHAAWVSRCATSEL